MNLAIVKDVHSVDQRPPIFPCDLALDTLSELRELGQRVVLTEIQPLPADLHAGLPGVDLLDQADKLLCLIRHEQVLPALAEGGHENPAPFGAGTPSMEGSRASSPGSHPS